MTNDQSSTRLRPAIRSFSSGRCSWVSTNGVFQDLGEDLPADVRRLLGRFGGREPAARSAAPQQRRPAHGPDRHQSRTSRYAVWRTHRMTSSKAGSGRQEEVVPTV